MRKLLLPALFLLMLTAPLIGEEPAKARPVSVYIDSRPDFAEIQVDGKFIGTTPLNYHLTPGMHRVTLTRSRFTAWTRDLLVTDGVPTRVGGLLEQTTAQNPCATETPSGR
ncbi:MAG: PEGA domain-containing protein [Acidobacteriota bacterium]|nr:PEGA domain-containing protein [Acidobacteriota bacterium]